MNTKMHFVPRFNYKTIDFFVLCNTNTIMHDARF